MRNKQDNIQTDNLCLAGVLSMVCPLASVSRNQGRGRATFVFPNTEEARVAVDEYWGRKRKVDPIDFFNHLKTIKSRLYDHDA